MCNLESALLEETQEIGIVKKAEDVITALTNMALRHSRTELTQTDIHNLFNYVEIFYFFRDSKSNDDFFQGTEEEFLNYKDTHKRPPFAKLVKLCPDYTIFKNDIYLSFKYFESIEPNTPPYQWFGSYAGEWEYLLNKLYRRNLTYKAREVNYVQKEFAPFDSGGIEETIYQMLFDTEHWKDETKTGSEAYLRLSNYLKYLSEAIINKLEKNMLTPPYCHESEKDGRSYVLFNSRLLSKFGNWIYFIYRKNKMWPRDAVKAKNYLTEPVIVNSNEELKKYGFEEIWLEDIPPIKFYNNVSELIFPGTEDTFQSVDDLRLSHIISERAERLPESLRCKSPMDLSFLVKRNMDFALKMAKVNFNYFIPSYSIERDCIQFLMPFYETFSNDSKPCCFFVVNQIERRWTLNTILPLENAYDTARLLNVPVVSWL